MTIFNCIQRNVPKLFKFGIVGSVGALINFFIYFLASEIEHLSVNVSAILAFCVAVSNNYVLNHFWTFRAENGSDSVNIRQFVYYLFGNIQGLIINLIVLNLVVFLAGVNSRYWGQGLGILLGMLSNFIFAKTIVFNRRFAE